MAALSGVFQLRRHPSRDVTSEILDGPALERGTSEQVRAEVRRQILETNALETGGMFVGSSSETNPPIKSENFAAMIEAVGELRSSNGV